MPTLIERFETYEQRSGLAEGTITLRRGQFARFEKATGLPLDDRIKAEDIQAWLDTLVLRNGRPISDKTRSCYITSFSSMYKWATVQDIIAKNPIDKIERPKVHGGMPNPVPDSDLARAMKAAGPLMKCWIALEGYGGLRCMEVAALEARDIRRDIGMVHIRHGKGDKERYVPLHSEIEKALKAYDKEPLRDRRTAFRVEGEGRLWPRTNPASVSQRINRFMHGMGITRTAHKLRHRAGTQIHKSSGGDLLVVQRFLGHSSPSTSAIYAGIEDEEVKTAAMAIPVAGRKKNDTANDYLEDEDSIEQ